MSQPRRTLEQIFQAQVKNLALTLQPFTVVKYDYVARHFVSYLRSTFPEVRRLSQLRRDPHMLGWFRWLCELRRPIGNHTREQRLLCLRRLLDDLAAQGHPINAPQPYHIPSLSVSDDTTSDLPGIRHALAATRHLLEMYRRQLSDDKTSRRLQRLDRRLLDVDHALQNIATAQK
jgi:hypothetical protein